MDDERAKNIADVYLANIRQANRIGVSQEQAPFVAVCLTMGDMLTGSNLDREMRILQREIDRMRMFY